MDVIPGVLDATAERAFTYGACAGLAIALHDRLGWTLIKVTDADSVYLPDTYQSLETADLAQRASLHNMAGTAGALHWLVLHPTGRLLDIDGLHDPAAVVERYDDEADNGVAALGRASRDDAIDEYVDAKGEPVPLDVCASFIDAVLQRVPGP